MGVSLSAKGAKSESDIGSGKPLAGRYLAMIKTVDETFEKNDDVIIGFEVLAGTVPDQKGRILTEYFKTSDRAIPRLTRLAMCLGLLRPDEVADVAFTQGIGRVLFIDIGEHSYENKEKVKVETVQLTFSGMWSVGNPDVADLHQVPEIAATINRLRGGGGGAAGAAVSAPNPTPQPFPQSDANKWAGLLS